MSAGSFVRAVGLASLVVMALPATAHALAYDRAYSFGTQAAGVAVSIDRAAGIVYVAQPLVGNVERFDLAGDPLDPATLGGGPYGGVAVDQASRLIHVFDPGLGGSPSIATFDPSGAPADPPSFPVTANPLPALEFNQIAVDSAGTIYYPNAFADSVERFGPDGTPQGSIGSGGALVDPSSVAVDSSGDVYVVDGVMNGGSACEGGLPCDQVENGRVQKFPAGGGPPLAIHDGNASSVAVDPATDDVLVGDGIGSSFQVVVYDESGSELTRFGSGLFGGAGMFPGFSNEIAVSGARRVYVTDPGSAQVEMFDVLPEATTGAALDVGEVATTLTGTVDPNGSSLFGCRFEYGTTPDPGRSKPCASTPGAGDGDVEVSAGVAGLAPGTTYHYRVVATNVGGTADGGDRTFTTVAAPTPPAPNPGPQPPPKPAGTAPEPCAKECAGTPAAGKARVSANLGVRSGKVRLRLTCTGSAGAACKGKLKLVAKLRAPKGKKAKRRTVGSGTYDVAAGKAARLEIELSRSARQVLARKGRLKVQISGAAVRRQGVVLVSTRKQRGNR